jgi:ribosomal protein S18 acetylase RimI-like enzyme
VTSGRRIEHRLRAADRNDLPHLNDIARTAFSDDPSLDLASLQRDGTLFLAEWRTAVDGFIVLLPMHNSLLIHRMAVAVEARGAGLGAWMLDCAVQHARDLDFIAVDIQRPIEDRIGIDWLRRHGFVPEPHGGNRIYLRRLTATRKPPEDTR